MPHLKHDDTFLYDTKDASVGDGAAAAKWQGILRLGQMRTDLDDATALYNQYWQNNGKRTAFDYSEAYREDDAVRRNIDHELLVAAEAADGFAQDGRTSFRMTGGLMPREAISGPVTENWQKAIGGYQQWSHADVRVEGDRVTMDITVEAQDYYNFDKGKADQATGINDAENGRFAEIGWARPLESYGSVTRRCPGASATLTPRRPTRAVSLNRIRDARTAPTVSGRAGNCAIAGRPART
ncbi:hypothetical protein ACFU44_00990 [Nocardia rhizosphaerihabitans]|uniref:hypothetical protein n=1 Tax=Nocardia rhizosphaerihabitans TaxID=1691570 RepID=UPI0036730E02